ncbi:hypothetical protein [Streptomyces sp. NPDC058542]|uniref:hypothetical protein n=1 Tax=Streptomyces sp. NPDC058542 TaxID=3346543 RepID=UPI0036639FB1
MMRVHELPTSARSAASPLSDQAWASPLDRDLAAAVSSADFYRLATIRARAEQQSVS